MKCKIKTIKAFESFLSTNHFGSFSDSTETIDKREYIEKGYDEPDRKLWLYYLKGKHIGTYNRTAKTCFTF